MKLITDTKSLVESITWATKTMDQNTQVVLDVNEDGEAFLTYSAPQSYMRAPLPLSEAKDVDDEVRAPLDGSLLRQLIPAFNQVSGDVELSFTGEGTSKVLKVKSLSYASTHFSVAMYSSRVPAAPSVVKIGETSDAEYFDYIARLANFCDPSNEAAYPAVGSVDISFNREDNKLTMMATNRWSLAEIALDFDSEEDADEELFGKHFLVPAGSAAMVSPTKGSLDNVEIVYDETNQKYGYRFADGRIALFGLTDARPTPYARTKENASQNVELEATVDLQTLDNTIKTLSGLPWAEGSIFWTVTDSKFEIHDKSRDNVMEIDASTNLEEGTSAELAFVSYVVRTAFKAARTKRVKLKWGEEFSHVVIVPVLDDGSDATDVFAFAGGTS